MTQANALARVSTGALQQQTGGTIQHAPTLDRENLQFFANMIEAAGLIPAEKEQNGQPMSIAKSKARVMAKIVGATYYGFDPISAQENLHIINGKLTLSAKGMSQLLHRSGKYATRQEYLNEKGCKLAVLQKNDKGDWILIGHVEFTREMAAKAGLVDKTGSLYKKFAEDMFFARCISRVVKRFAPEVLDGQAVNYRLAKEEPQPELLPDPEPLPQNVPETAAVGEVYQDQMYSDQPGLMSSLMNDDGVEAEFTETIEPDLVRDDDAGELETLRAIAREKLADLAPEQRKRVLKGRDVEMMELEPLKAMIENDLAAF